MRAFAVLVSLACLGSGTTVSAERCVRHSGSGGINIEEWLCLVDQAAADFQGTQSAFLGGLRKRYYGGGGDSWGNVPRVGQLLGIKNLWDLVVPAGKNIPRLDFPSGSELSKYLSPRYQEVTGPDGKALDIGHALVGLESCRSPSTSRYFRFGLGLSKGPPVATWAGDAGSVLSGLVVARRTRPGTTVASVFSGASSPADMRGNADAHALHGLWRRRPSASLPTVLRAYYDSAGDSVCARSRFSGFAVVAGFADARTGAIVPGVREKIRETIRANARAPMIKDGDGWGQRLKTAAGFMPWSDQEEGQVVQRFISEGFTSGMEKEMEAVGGRFSSLVASHYAPGSCAHFE